MYPSVLKRVVQHDGIHVIMTNQHICRGNSIRILFMGDSGTQLRQNSFFVIFTGFIREVSAANDSRCKPDVLQQLNHSRDNGRLSGSTGCQIAHRDNGNSDGVDFSSAHC